MLIVGIWSMAASNPAGERSAEVRTSLTLRERLPRASSVMAWRSLIAPSQSTLEAAASKTGSGAGAAGVGGAVVTADGSGAVGTSASKAGIVGWVLLTSAAG